MNLLTKHLDTWTTAPNGIKKLRELILELAVRGLLVPQNPDDEPASILLEKIAAEKARLISEGKIKKSAPLPKIADDEKPFDLPTNWSWVRWNDIAMKIGDIDHKMPEQQTDGIPYVSPRDFLPKNKIDFDGAKKISLEDFSRLAEKIQPQRGDIIYPRYGTIGENRIVETDKDFLASYSCCVIKTLHGFISPSYQFIFSMSNCTKTQAKKAENKTTQPNVGIQSIQQYLVPLPPLAEQHRIVAKVDELMQLCDQLEQKQTSNQEIHAQLVSTLLTTLTQATDPQAFQAAWTRIAANFDSLFTTESSIEQLKQTILQLAVMGKLVEQEAGDEPASVLLEKIAQEKARLISEGKIKKSAPLPKISDDEKPFDLPDGWKWVRLGNVTELITSGSRDWAKYYSNSGAIFVTMGNLSKNEYTLRMNTIRYVNLPENEEGSRTKLEAKDLLISITGDVGNLGLIPEEFGEAYINQHTCLLRFMKQCRNLYFPELMRSPLAKYQFDAPQRGIKNSFRLSDIGEMIVPLPPLPEQHRIVAKVDELMAVCDQLKTKLNTAQTLQTQLAEALVLEAVG